jgi:UDP-N-acetylglucosamine 2-epimerase (non-hydrolysing)
LKFCVVLGTRPEIIKMSPVIQEFERRRLDYFVLHTGQHYSYNMDKVFFDVLALPEASYNLDVGSGSHGEQTGKMLIGIGDVLKKEHPDVVLVQGDTNTVLAGAIVAAKLGIKVAHVESGLRSFDRTMPEEVNRVLADHCSDYLFAPTEVSKNNLISEGITNEKIFVVGNTVVDALSKFCEPKNGNPKALDKFGLSQNCYCLVTIHRQENVDNKERFANVLSSLSRIKKEFGFPVVYPIHPRSRKQMQEFGLTSDGVMLVDPVDFISFLQLEQNAKLILTDSGGVQEEACIFGVPCVTLRDNTERPETVDVGANILAGTKPDKVVECAKIMARKRGEWANPFGDGTAGKKIVEVLLDPDS